MARKPSKGRCKIDMKMIRNESSRQVTFSKRRFGLFKKASELNIMCGAHVAIIVFSPAGKAFTFGHPSIESVVNCVFSDGASSSVTAITSQRILQISEMNKDLIEILDLYDIEKKRGEKLKASVKAVEQEIISKTFEELDINDLEVLKDSLEALKNNIIVKTDELVDNNRSSPSSTFDNSLVTRMMDF